MQFAPTAYRDTRVETTRQVITSRVWSIVVTHTLDPVVTFNPIETQRLTIQSKLDAVKTQTERNKLGQFATPPQLATEILAYAKTIWPDQLKIHFFDPAFGTGAFYSALLRIFLSEQIIKASGFEIDPHYGYEAVKLWSNTLLKLRIEDFTQARPPDRENDKANLLICNPPYVRHHHLANTEKLRLRGKVQQITGLKLGGLTGLYCYFLLLAHDWLAESGLAGWLIPSEFMDVNYGEPIKRYLLQHVTLLRVHHFDPHEVQFDDALVSSTIIWFKKAKPSPHHEIEFSYGGTLAKPRVSRYISIKSLEHSSKWSGLLAKKGESTTRKQSFKLADLFEIKRGIATGANKFFMLTPKQIADYQLPTKFLIPILPSPRYLPTEIIEADNSGNPILDQQLFLLACNLSENEVKINYPSLWAYLQTGIQAGIDKRYLCQNRTPWYSQEDRPASPLLCTYMGRGSTKNKKSPFRFILNYSCATAPNVYLMLYPKPILKQSLDGQPELLQAIWQALSKLPSETLVREGRLYGGGLHKIEPRELANAPADDIVAILPKLANNQPKQLSLFE
jgi:hypothetical protein